MKIDVLVANACVGFWHIDSLCLVSGHSFYLGEQIRMKSDASLGQDISPFSFSFLSLSPSLTHRGMARDQYWRETRRDETREANTVAKRITICFLWSYTWHIYSATLLSTLPYRTVPISTINTLTPIFRTCRCDEDVYALLILRQRWKLQRRDVDSII